MDRKLNSLSLFLLVVVFITSASTLQQWYIFLGLILSAVFSLIVFLFRWLSLDGMFAAIVIGTFILGLGGWAAAGVVLLFFISSAVLTSIRPDPADRSANKIRRDGYQVWANGFWLVVCLVFTVVFSNEIFMIGAMAAVATATADTWGTESGSRKSNSTYLITNFKTVPPGTDGGISLQGTLASLAGSVIIAGASIYVFSLEFYDFLSIFIAGFLGSVVDSYLGAIFQQNNSSVSLPVLDYKMIVGNNLVNSISTGAGALLAIILKLLIG